MERTASVSTIKGVGEKTQKLFGKLNIFTLEDVLEHYPRNYEVYEAIKPIRAIEEGEVAAVYVQPVATLEVKRRKGLTLTTGRIRDKSGDLYVIWFNMPYIKKQIRPGTTYILRGRVTRQKQGMTMEQPQIISREDFEKRKHVMQPVYPLTTGLTNNAVSKAVAFALKNVEFSEDYLPLEIRRAYDLISYKEALFEIHFPKSKDSMIRARRRIVFDEFFLFILAMKKIKETKKQKNNFCEITEFAHCKKFMEQLPYQLTNAQKKVWEEVKADISGDYVMNRLIQGDVGSGKTVIAQLALLATAESGYQGAIMVPTEVLARQHFESFQKSFAPYGVEVALLTGSMKASEKKLVYQKLKSHEIDIVVGTHALIQEAVEFDRLALVVTDEQHRFGVKQRESLIKKGYEPHTLVMSATPIPRTLAIILYGDLDLSVIDELPGERLPIKNCVVNNNYRQTAYRFIEKEVSKGNQVYVICPMVEESENLEAENVIDYTEKLKMELAPYIRVEYLHGKMKNAQKNDIMERFSAGEIHVLVSTTVIEVGINVPNATVMMVENAERFGLAQLHQLRGRVGRGNKQSYCIFMSNQTNKETMERLETLNKSNDGFFIANEDLRLRGPGDLFGIRQSGMFEFKLADVFNDAAILKDANECAKEFEDSGVRLMLKKYQHLRRKIEVYGEGLYL
ncbi:MAG: ATP-dependent DNA helicase RecG [Lachnospiraceae bacterium]|nr:ATP-dependent DNA helicase RecG [Lachnospiraceae bacterium]